MSNKELWTKKANINERIEKFLIKNGFRKSKISTSFYKTVIDKNNIEITVRISNHFKFKKHDENEIVINKVFQSTEHLIRNIKQLNRKYKGLFKKGQMTYFIEHRAEFLD